MAPRKTHKKVHRVPAVGSRAQVFRGNAKHTSGGLTKDKLVKTPAGRIVPRSKRALGKKNPWIKAVTQARKELKPEGFTLLLVGQPLHTRARQIYDRR